MPLPLPSLSLPPLPPPTLRHPPRNRPISTNRRVSHSFRKRSYESMDKEEEVAVPKEEDYDSEEAVEWLIRFSQQGSSSPISGVRSSIRRKPPPPLEFPSKDPTLRKTRTPSPEFNKNFDEFFDAWWTEESPSLPSSPPGDLSDLFEEAEEGEIEEWENGGEEEGVSFEWEETQEDSSSPGSDTQPGPPQPSPATRAKAAKARFEEIQHRSKRRRIDVTTPSPPIIIFTTPSPPPEPNTPPPSPPPEAVDEITPSLLQPTPWRPRSPPLPKRPALPPWSPPPLRRPSLPPQAEQFTKSHAAAIPLDAERSPPRGRSRYRWPTLSLSGQ